MNWHNYGLNLFLEYHISSLVKSTTDGTGISCESVQWANFSCSRLMVSLSQWVYGFQTEQPNVEMGQSHSSYILHHSFYCDSLNFNQSLGQSDKTIVRSSVNHKESRNVILHGQNFLNCFEISWKNVLSYSCKLGRISWKQEIYSNISWKITYLEDIQSMPIWDCTISVVSFLTYARWCVCILMGLCYYWCLNHN